jgi:hypothetical protein
MMMMLMIVCCVWVANGVWETQTGVWTLLPKLLQVVEMEMVVVRYYYY